MSVGVNIEKLVDLANRSTKLAAEVDGDGGASILAEHSEGLLLIEVFALAQDDDDPGEPAHLGEVWELLPGLDDGSWNCGASPINATTTFYPTSNAGVFEHIESLVGSLL